MEGLSEKIVDVLREKTHSEHEIVEIVVDFVEKKVTTTTANPEIRRGFCV